MKSTLEKTVTKQVKTIKHAEETAAAKKAREDAAYQAKLPKTREERAQIMYPSITDGGKWDYYFAAGHWRLRFFVNKHEFEICDVYYPADSGTPTEGYYGHDAGWAPHLFAKDPWGERMFDIGSVEEIHEGYIAGRNDPPSKHKDGKLKGQIYWDPKKVLAEAVKKTNDGIAEKVKEFMLHRDDIPYMRRYEDRRW